MGFVTSIVFGWLAVLDYYDYINIVSPFFDELIGIPVERRGLRPSKEL